jgi:hypothetical protein
VESGLISTAVWWNGNIILPGDPWWDAGYPGSQPIWVPDGEIWIDNIPQDEWNYEWVYDQNAQLLTDQALIARLLARQAEELAEEEARKARLRRKKALERAVEAPELAAALHVIEIIRKFGPIH